MKGLKSKLYNKLRDIGAKAVGAQLSPTFLFVCLIAISIIVSIFIVSSPICEQQYTDLAHGFLQGHLYFPDNELRQDVVPFDGHNYWALGIFPALILLPFVAIFQLFGGYFYQEYLFVPLVLATIYLFYKLVRKLGADLRDALWWCLAFVIGTSFLGIITAAMSWYLASLIGLFLLTAAILEFFTRRRWWLLGTLTGMLFLTRPTAAVALGVFLLLMIVFDKNVKPAKKINLKQKMIWITKLALPCLLALLVFFGYNYARFGDVLTTNYDKQVYLDPESSQYDRTARQFGVFSVRHIPGQLYNTFFATPTPVYEEAPVMKAPFIKVNPYGLGLFIVSPWLLWIFTRSRKEFSRKTILLLVAAGIGVLLNACFFGLGYVRFGQRYNLDYLPFLFAALLMLYYKHGSHLTRGMKVLFVASGLFNLYLLLTIL